MESSDIIKEPFPMLFASGINANINLVGSSESGFSFPQGIPTMYASRTGKKVNRADINGIGRMVSQSKIFNQLGGYFTFSPNVSNAIGGYPLGAILYYKDQQTGKIRLVRSLVENNTFNFVETPSFIDNYYWSFVDDIVPTSFRPRIFPDKLEPEMEKVLSVGDSFFSPYDSLVIIQTGIDEENEPEQEPEDESSDESPDIDIGGDPIYSDDTSRIFFYATVKRHNETEYHDAACLGCRLPIGEAYDLTSEALNASIMQKAIFTSYYASSPVQIYLHAGDTMKIISSTPISGISFKMKAIKLTS